MDFGQFKIKGGTEKPAGMVKPVFGHDRMKSALTFCPSAYSTSQDASERRGCHISARKSWEYLHPR